MELDEVQCPRCQSGRVVTGYFVNASGFKQPALMRFDVPRNFWLRLFSGTSRYLHVGAESAFCLDCGLVWAALDPETVEKLVQTRGSQQLCQRLGLSHETTKIDDELA